MSGRAFDDLTPENLALARGPVGFPVTREIASVTDDVVDGIPVRVYQGEQPPTGVIVYFHGGGFCIGSIGLMDNVARELTHCSDAVVVSVEYRLAPENPYPAGLDDCEAITRWAFANAASFGVTRQQVAVAGESAGGNLSAALALRLHNDTDHQLAAQVLMYPGLDNNASTHLSRSEFDGLVLTAKARHDVLDGVHRWPARTRSRSVRRAPAERGLIGSPARARHPRRVRPAARRGPALCRTPPRCRRRRRRRLLPRATARVHQLHVPGRARGVRAHRHLAAPASPSGRVSVLFGLRFDFRNPDFAGTTLADRYAAALDMAAVGRPAGMREHRRLRAPRLARRLPAEPDPDGGRDGGAHDERALHDRRADRAVLRPAAARRGPGRARPPEPRTGRPHRGGRLRARGVRHVRRAAERAGQAGHRDRRAR